MFRRVLCAVDRSDATERVLRHAAGIAAVAHARLTLIHVDDESPTADAQEEWRRHYYDALPYGAAYVPDPDVRVVPGPASETILAHADKADADLIVCGARGRGPFAGWLLGSTSRSLLRAASRPMLIIPSSDVDIVTLTDARPELNFGAVIAAIDFGEHNAAQLQLASAIAALAEDPLLLLTVLAADDPLTDHAAAEALRGRAHKLTPIKPDAIIVRRGDVPDEIARCAARQNAGIIVMGVRTGGRQRPGAIASAVLEWQRPAVLAVPDRVAALCKAS